MFSAHFTSQIVCSIVSARSKVFGRLFWLWYNRGGVQIWQNIQDISERLLTKREVGKERMREGDRLHREGSNRGLMKPENSKRHI